MMNSRRWMSAALFKDLPRSIDASIDGIKAQWSVLLRLTLTDRR